MNSKSCNLVRSVSLFHMYVYYWYSLLFGYVPIGSVMIYDKYEKRSKDSEYYPNYLNYV